MHTEETEKSKKYTMTLADGKEVSVEIFCQALCWPLESCQQIGHTISISVEGIGKKMEPVVAGYLLHIGDQTKDPRLLPLANDFLQQFIRELPPGADYSIGPRSNSMRSIEATIRFSPLCHATRDTVADSKEAYARLVEKLDAAMPEFEVSLQKAYTGPHEMGFADRFALENEMANSTAVIALVQKIEMMGAVNDDPSQDGAFLEYIISLLPSASQEQIRSNTSLLEELQTQIKNRHAVMAKDTLTGARTVAESIANLLTGAAITLRDPQTLDPRRN